MMSGEQHTEQKWCPRCRKPKSIDDFGRNKRHSDGLQSWCKKCGSEYNRQCYKKNPDPAKERAGKYYTKNREKCIASQRKRRQKKKPNLPAQNAWRGPPVKIYTKEERKELERRILNEHPKDVPRDWYEILPAAAKKFLEEYPAVKRALRGHYIDGADFTFINYLRKHLHKYRHLTEHQIDQAIAISQNRAQ